MIALGVLELTASDAASIHRKILNVKAFFLNESDFKQLYLGLDRVKFLHLFHPEYFQLFQQDI